MSKEIKLTKGLVAIVDDSDYEHLDQWKWHVCGVKGSEYAARRQYYMDDTGVRKSFYVYMHRQIMNTPSDMDTDHANGDKLDNRRDNLRICTTAENLANRGPLPTRNKSGFKGVSYEGSKWIAQIGRRSEIGHTNKILGRFDTPEEAARAYDRESFRRFGKFAKLNFQEGG